MQSKQSLSVASSIRHPFALPKRHKRKQSKREKNGMEKSKELGNKKGIRKKQRREKREISSKEKRKYRVETECLPLPFLTERISLAPGTFFFPFASFFDTNSTHRALESSAVEWRST